MKVKVIQEFYVSEEELKLEKFTKSDFPELHSYFQKKYGSYDSPYSIFFKTATTKLILERAPEFYEAYHKKDKTLKDRWIRWWFIERIQNSKIVEVWLKNLFIQNGYNDLSKAHYDKYYKTDLLMEKDDKYYFIQVKAFFNSNDLSENSHNQFLVNKMKDLQQVLNINKESHYIKIMFDKFTNKMIVIEHI